MRTIIKIKKSTIEKRVHLVRVHLNYFQVRINI